MIAPAFPVKTGPRKTRNSPAGLSSGARIRDWRYNSDAGYAKIYNL